MHDLTHSPIVAVDIGNSRAKIGLFQLLQSGDSPEPVETVTVSRAKWDEGRLTLSVPGGEHATWWIASVNRPFAASLMEWLGTKLPAATVEVMSHEHLPLKIDVEHPERVGMDRLAGATAANRLRRPECAAIIIDVGSAITVDLVSQAGAFRGGSIFPGIGMAARALHEFTDLLPRLQLEDLTGERSPADSASSLPDAVGRSTTEAMRSGLFWGPVGAMRELVSLIKAEARCPCDVFLTGGAAPSVARLLGPDVQHVPHLVLSGIALAAASRKQLDK